MTNPFNPSQILIGLSTLKQTLVYSSMTSLRVALMIGAFGWFVALTLPMPFALDIHLLCFPDKIHTTSYSPYYWMGQIAPQWAWAAAFFAHSVVMLASLVTTINSRIHAIDAFCGLLLWSTLVISMTLSFYHEGVSVVEHAPLVMDAVAVLASLWWLLRVVIDGGVSNGRAD